MNCCLKFLFLNSLAGIFIFIVLGTFIITDNPFLMTMNFKEKDGKKEYNNKTKKNAYLQYFAAAGFNIFFAFTIWFLTYLKEYYAEKKKEIIPIKNEMKIIEEKDDIINTNNNNNEIIIKENDDKDKNGTDNDINTINYTETGKSVGMSEKIE